MCRTAGKQRARFCTSKAIAYQRCAAAQPQQTEPRHEERMRRDANRPENLAEQCIRIPYEWLHERGPCRRVRPERFAGRVNIAIQHGRRAIFKWVCDGCGRSHPFEAVAVERQRFVQRRDDAHWMNSRANIVNKSRPCYLTAAASATSRIVGFEHEDRVSRVGQHNRRRQAVRARTHDNCVVHARHLLIVVPRKRRARLPDRTAS